MRSAHGDVFASHIKPWLILLTMQGMILNSKAFDTYASTIKADDLVSFINLIPSGQILCFAIRVRMGW